MRSLAARKLTFLPFIVFLTGCGASASSYVHTPNDTTLGRVVVYRNGVAYFERTADVDRATASSSASPPTRSTTS